MHVWDFLDGRLADEQADAARGHLAVCDACREYQRVQENFLEALGSLRVRVGAPPSVRERVLRSLREVGFVS